uniref:peptidylprolyl isomerase n=1 Tax=Oryctolagus cuniculus TaxID=9986 RepID=G1TMB9_RABIT
MAWEKHQMTQVPGPGHPRANPSTAPATVVAIWGVNQWMEDLSVALPFKYNKKGGEALRQAEAAANEPEVKTRDRPGEQPGANQESSLTPRGRCSRFLLSKLGYLASPPRVRRLDAQSPLLDPAAPERQLSREAARAPASLLQPPATPPSVSRRPPHALHHTLHVSLATACAPARAPGHRLCRPLSPALRRPRRARPRWALLAPSRRCTCSRHHALRGPSHVSPTPSAPSTHPIRHCRPTHMRTPRSRARGVPAPGTCSPRVRQRGRRLQQRHERLRAAPERHGAVGRGLLDITLWGMELGLLSMRRGELARFLFTPTYAYGALGCPPLIPPNTTVLFEIELLDFLDSAESDTFCALSAEQQDQFPLQKVLKVAATEREFGNYLFRQNRFCDAKARYKRALLLLHRRSAAPGEQHLVEAAKLLVLLNLSFTYLKLERPAPALCYGEQALDIDNKNTKALFRCGQACLLMTEYEKARDFLVRAQKQQPFNHDINSELKKLASCYKDYTDREREMCHRMFAPCADGPAMAQH